MTKENTARAIKAIREGRIEIGQLFAKRPPVTSLRRLSFLCELRFKISRIRVLEKMLRH